MLQDLGDEYLITRTGIKPHACCRYKQGPIDCLIDIKGIHDLEADDVEGVTIGVLSGGYKLIASPEEEKANPKTVVDMQFSMPFGAAVALAYGRASLQEYADGVPDRPEVRRIMQQVKCVTDPELGRPFPQGISRVGRGRHRRRAQPCAATYATPRATRRTRFRGTR